MTKKMTKTNTKTKTMTKTNTLRELHQRASQTLLTFEKFDQGDEET